MLLALIIAALIYDWANTLYDILNGYVITSPTGFLAIFVYARVSVPLITGATILSVVGLRSKKDPVLRKHLLWFGLFAAFLLTFPVVLSNLFADPLQTLLTQDLGVVFGGYCLYKSARSLVPLNRLSPFEVVTK